MKSFGDQHLGSLCTLARIIDTLVPADFPELTSDARKEIIQCCALDVEEIIKKMPPHLRIAFRSALPVFEYSALFRHGNRFSNLRPAARHTHLNAWTQSRFGVKRDFIKLIRNLALFHFYDRAEVTARIA